MTRLSIKALRLYDENGLLPPASVDSTTGYRYYRSSQAGRADVIRALRSVEMPLEEIRAVLDSDNPDAAMSVLFRHRTRLAQQLNAQERMLAYLETIIRQKERVMPYEIEITEASPQQIAAIRVTTNLRGISGAIGAGFGKIMPALASSGQSMAGPPFVIYHDTIDEENDGDIEICAPVASPLESAGDVCGRELEGGRMATTVHKGPYEEIGAAYRTLMSWIAENGYEMGGPPREIYLNDPEQVAPAELLTRVEWPIRGGSH